MTKHKPIRLLSPLPSARTLLGVSALLCFGPLLSGCQPQATKEVSSKTNDLDAVPSKTMNAGTDIDVAPNKSTTLDVQTATAKSGELSVQRSTNATIKATRDSGVAPLLGGVVKQVNVEEGQLVQQGQLLMMLDDNSQRQAVENAKLQVEQARISLEQLRNNTAGGNVALEAAVEAAQEALSNAERNKNSTEQVYEMGGASLADLQNARSQYAQAQSTLSQAENNLRQSGRSSQSSIPLQEVQLQSAQTTLRQAEQNLERTKVTAPFAGVVAKINVREGEFATQSSPVLRLVDPKSVRAEFTVPANDAVNLPVGKVVRLRYLGKRYQAKIAENAGIADKTRLATMSVQLIDDVTLPVGATARITYRRILGNGTLIPSAAVQANTGENAVYVVEPSSDDSYKVRRQVIQVQAESGGMMAVTGVDAGQQLVSPVPASLQNGMQVRLFEAKADSSKADSTAQPDAAQPSSQPSSAESTP